MEKGEFMRFVFGMPEETGGTDCCRACGHYNAKDAANPFKGGWCVLYCKSGNPDWDGDELPCGLYKKPKPFYLKRELVMFTKIPARAKREYEIMKELGL